MMDLTIHRRMLQLIKHDISGAWLVTKDWPEQRFTNPGDAKHFEHNHGSLGGTRRWSWLRLCATSRKIAGSIPDSVNGNFHWHNPSGRTMAPELTQPLTEMSTRTFTCRLSWNLGASGCWNPQGLSKPVMGLLYVLPLPWQSYPNK